MVAPKPQVVRHIQNQTVQPNQRALFQCVSKGAPDADVKWYHNGKPVSTLANNARLPTTYDRFSGVASLSVLNARPEDAGQYTCVVSSPAGSETSTAFLVVRGIAFPKGFYTGLLFYSFQEHMLEKLNSRKS